MDESYESQSTDYLRMGDDDAGSQPGGGLGGVGGMIGSPGGNGSNSFGMGSILSVGSPTGGGGGGGGGGGRVVSNTMMASEMGSTMLMSSGGSSVEDDAGRPSAMGSPMYTHAGGGVNTNLNLMSASGRIPDVNLDASADEAAFAAPPSPPRTVFKPFGAPGSSLSEGLDEDEGAATDNDDSQRRNAPTAVATNGQNGQNGQRINGPAATATAAAVAVGSVGAGYDGAGYDGAGYDGAGGAGEGGVTAPFLSDKDEAEFMNPTPTIRDAWRAASKSKPGSAKKGRPSTSGGTNGANGANGSGDEDKEDHEMGYYRDAWAAGLFLLHVLIVLIVAVGLGASASEASNGKTGSINASMVGGVTLLLAMSAVLATAWQQFLMHYGSAVISCMLWTSVLMSGIMCVVYFVAGAWVMGVLFILITLAAYFYSGAVKERIPFASSNLRTACIGVKHFSPKLPLVAAAALLAQCFWILIWAVAFLGFRASPNADNPLAYFLMLVSFYWGCLVVVNVVHVATAGAVASWWFDGDNAPNPVSGATKRALTTSFGSICLGSLVVAVLKATVVMLRGLRDQANKRGQDGAAMVICCTEWLIRIIEGWMKYFNRWAFVFVAVYGLEFKDAGQKTHTLFRRLGWTAIVNDDLIQNALALGCLVTGAFVGVVGYTYGLSAGLGGDNAFELALWGLVIGYFLTKVLMGLVDSAVATIFVCFAQDPQAFQRTHPQLYNELVESWAAMHGPVMRACGYSANEADDRI